MNKSYVPELEVIREWSIERIYKRYHKTEMYVGSSDSIRYIEEQLIKFEKSKNDE